MNVIGPIYGDENPALHQAVALGLKDAQGRVTGQLLVEGPVFYVESGVTLWLLLEDGDEIRDDLPTGLSADQSISLPNQIRVSHRTYDKNPIYFTRKDIITSHFEQYVNDLREFLDYRSSLEKGIHS